MSRTPGKFAPNAEVYRPDYYERMYRPHWFLRNRRKYEERDAALLRIVRPSPFTRVLEVGSARGDTAFFFAPRVKEVVGIDAAPVAIAAARARLAALALPNVRFEEADARDLSTVSGGPFDVVLLADFVEHVLDDVLLPCLRSARLVLREGGALAIYTPNATHWAERLILEWVDQRRYRGFERPNDAGDFAPKDRPRPPALVIDAQKGPVPPLYHLPGCRHRAPLKPRVSITCFLGPSKRKVVL